VASTVFDSALFKDVFGSAEMRAVFSDEALIAAAVRVEIALAVAQGRTGVIPREAADAIATGASGQELDWAALKRDTENVGYPILGLVRQLAARLGEPGKYLHWGATTQDIMDTAVVLQIAPRSGSCGATSRRSRPPSRCWPSATATRRCPAAPTCSRPCR
jgi:3-carboxy-cis,cis-muconate cycloisomerase